MEVIPAVRTARFEQLEPGELFLFIDHERKFLALKTQQPSNGDRSQLVILGPTFPGEVKEAFLLQWQAVTTLSLGKNFSILLPIEAESWTVSGPNRQPVCLALANDRLYICTNGGPHPSRFFQCFVDVETGAIIEGKLSGNAVFTNNWEIVIFGKNDRSKLIVKYPLSQN